MSCRRFLALGVCALALIAAGCGGSGGDETPPSIGRAEFVKEANAICAKDEERLHTAFLTFSEERQSSTASSRVEGEESINVIIAPIMTQEKAELQALGAPKGDKERVEELFAAVEEGLQKARERPESVIDANSEMFGKAIKLAAGLGLSACAQLY